MKYISSDVSIFILFCFFLSFRHKEFPKSLISMITNAERISSDKRMNLFLTFDREFDVASSLKSFIENRAEKKERCAICIEWKRWSRNTVCRSLSPRCTKLSSLGAFVYDQLAIVKNISRIKFQKIILVIFSKRLNDIRFISAIAFYDYSQVINFRMCPRREIVFQNKNRKNRTLSRMFYKKSEILTCQLINGIIMKCKLH